MRHTGPSTRGLRAQATGVRAEAVCCAALVADGWTILGQRLRTPAGEIDLVAERDGLLAIIEVKHRPTLAEAAAAVSPRQRLRLIGAGEILLAQHPQWGRSGVRFDVMVVDGAARVRRIANAFRAE
jgi:putative endonuclease